MNALTNRDRDVTLRGSESRALSSVGAIRVARVRARRWAPTERGERGNSARPATHSDVRYSVYVATNVDLGSALVDEGVAVGGRRTKKETVTEALREHIAGRRQSQVTSVFRTLDYDPTYDYKKQRRRT